MDDLSTLIPFLIPILLLQIVLIVVALKDLFSRERTKGPRWAWALIILFVSLFGPIIYLLAGREE
jgi:uncharacterized membrane protein YozB (DUF420 family)